MTQLTAFPNGVSSFGMPVLPGIPPTTGAIYFVSSGVGDNSYAGTSARPLATIAAAVSLCTASKGDVIVLMPGHTETLSGAAAIALSKAGLTIIGLGNGTNRPTLTWHTTDATMTISAANVTLRNLRIKADVDAVVSMFNITVAGVTLDAVDFVETAACAALQMIITTAAADDLTVQNCSWVQTQTAATALQQWIVLVGADRFKFKNNFCNLKGYATANPANGVVVGATTASLDVEIVGNRLITTNSTGAVPISLLANSTGFVAQNYVASAKTAIAGSIGLASCYGAENYAAHVVNKNGLLEPVVDA